MAEITRQQAGSIAAFLVTFLLLMGTSHSAVGETAGGAEYVETTGTKRVFLTSWEIPRKDGFLLHSQGSNGETHDLLVDRQLRTVWWRFRAPERGIDVRAERSENRIEITGHIGARPINRTLEIDEAPWYQSIERSLVPFALGASGARAEFWVVQPYSLAPRKIQASNEGRKELELDGVTAEAAVVEISLPGFLALFWSSSYWYRVPDGKFVQFEGLRGPPGTPLTTVRLLRELP